MTEDNETTTDEKSEKDHVRTVLESQFPDRVFSVEEKHVWVSGMNQSCKSVAERMTEELTFRGFLCGLVHDDEAHRHGGFQFRWYGRKVNETNRPIRTYCDECGIPLHGDDGEELSHGSYCDLDASEYEVEA